MTPTSITDGIPSASRWFQMLVEAAQAPSWGWILGTRIALIVPFIGWLCIVRKHRSSWLTLAPLIALCGLSLISVAATSGADTDEVEHLHVSWLITQDVLPYRDIHQNHTPLLWLMAAPLVNVLPDSAYVLYAFRGLTLVALGVSIALACKLLHRIAEVEVVRLYPAIVFLALTQTVEAQMYRFRPDSFMVTCALGSLLCIVSFPRRPWLYASLAGLLIGLAISFSPKVVLQLGGGGLAVLIYFVRRQPLESVRLGVGYGGGLLLGLLPVLTWLGTNGLIHDAWQSIFPDNAEILTGRRSPASWFTSGHFLLRACNLTPYAAFMLAGALRILWPSTSRPNSTSIHPSSRLLLVAAAALFFVFAAVAPNYLTYHLSGGLILGAVLAAGVVERLLAWGKDGRWARSAIVAVALGLCMNDTWIRSGICGRVEGATAELANLESLRQVTQSRGETCLCLAPMHPIFAFDTGGMYTGFDRHSPRWSEALEEIMRRPPALVLDFTWQGLVTRGRLTPQQVSRLELLLSTHYEHHTIDGQGFWLLADEQATAVSLSGSVIPECTDLHPQETERDAYAP